MIISAIIPSRHRNAELMSLLRALAGQELPPDVSFEAIIALDGAPAAFELRHAAGNAPFPVRILELPHCGISQAKNEAIRAAKGDLLLFLNDDIIPAPDFAAEHVAAQHAAQFKHAILGWTAWQIPEPPTIMDILIKETPMIFFYNDMEPDQLHNFRHAWNLNLSAPRSLVEKAGYFAENLRPCMYEDIELAWRMSQLGCQVKYHPDASAVHAHRYTWDSYLRREIMLGLMAPVLWNVNKDCFLDIYKQPLDELTASAREAVYIDRPDDRKIYNWLNEIVALSSNASAASRDLQTLYHLHLPIKRRAFRAGLLLGADTTDNSWKDREVLPGDINLPEAMFPDKDIILTKKKPTKTIRKTGENTL